MKIKSLLIATLLLSSASFAQETAVADTTWKTGGLFSLGFNQVSLTNWAAGGISSVSGNGILSLFGNYAKNNKSWDNTLDIGYGLLKQGDGDLTKTDDRVELASKYGIQAWNEKWYYSALGSFRTQFTEGLGTPFASSDSLDGKPILVTPKISDILAPGYGILALGLDHKPNDNFTLFISPVTAKFTVVGVEELADVGAFGVDAGDFDENGNIIEGTGSNSRTELGAYLKAAYAKDIMENITLLTKIDLFTNYKDNPFTRTDVNWELLLGMKVNKYINVNLGFQAIYDHDITIKDDKDKEGPRLQFKELFGIGFAYEL
ncbi:MAG: hypothetical protein ACI8XB_000843 [Patiriisocius sp.]|jgi:hypothetical protein